jgi:formylglycine-generating enzyme required for sulfatase activity
MGGVEAARRLLAELIEYPRAPLPARLRAGAIVGETGDPRRGVCEIQPAWCQPFPAGEYLVRAQSPAPSTVRLGAFRIARYPVTNWQYRRFLDASGYRERRWWTEHGWRWRELRSVTRPWRWEELSSRLNHPVVGVSWYEAVAYCNWLTYEGRAAGWLAPGERIGLPTEAEWEVAACWDARVRAQRAWQAGAGELRQNAQGAGIRRTTPVGLFPSGAGPCGALDMAGNVWEWCAARDQREADAPPNEAGLVLRGGCYDLPEAESSWDARLLNSPVFQDVIWGFRVSSAGAA